MRTSPNVVITVRVMDKGNPDSALYERSVVDTPAADLALTSEEFQTLFGMDLATTADLVGAPFTSGSIGVGVFQYNPDGFIRSGSRRGSRREPVSERNVARA